MNDGNKPNFDLGDYLDKPIAEMPDMPTREILPNGTHVVQIFDVQRDQLGGKDAVIFTYKYLECVNLAKPSDVQPKAGTVFQELFFPASEGGIGALKMHITPVAPEGATLGQVLQAVIGQQFQITTSVRRWKDPKSGEERENHQTKGGLRLIGGA